MLEKAGGGSLAWTLKEIQLGFNWKSEDYKTQRHRQVVLADWPQTARQFLVHVQRAEKDMSSRFFISICADMFLPV